MKKIKIFGNLFVCTVLMLFFNNCSQSFRAAESGTDSASLSRPTDSAGGAEPQRLATGVELYTNNCSSCHGPLAISSKLGKTAVDIQSALNTQLQMSFLKSKLTADDISAIALALAPVVVMPFPSPGTTPTPSPVPGTMPSDGSLPSDFRPVVGNRYMVASDLSELFIADSALDTSDTSIQNIINNLVLSHPEAFGGNCSRYDPGCVPSPCYYDAVCISTLDTLVIASPLPLVSPITKGYTIRACEEILSVDKAVTTVVSKASLAVASPPTLDSIMTLMTFINRDRPSDMTSANALLNVASQAKASGALALDQWRMVILPLCLSATRDLY